MHASVNPQFHPLNVLAQMDESFHSMWMEFLLAHPEADDIIPRVATDASLAKILQWPESLSMRELQIKRGLVYLGRLLGDRYVMEQLRSNPLPLSAVAVHLYRADLYPYMMTDARAIDTVLPDFVLQMASYTNRLKPGFDGWDESQFRQTALHTLHDLGLSKQDNAFVSRRIDTYCETAHDRSVH